MLTVKAKVFFGYTLWPKWYFFLSSFRAWRLGTWKRTEHGTSVMPGVNSFCVFYFRWRVCFVLLCLIFIFTAIIIRPAGMITQALQRSTHGHCQHYSEKVPRPPEKERAVAFANQRVHSFYFCFVFISCIGLLFFLVRLHLKCLICLRSTIGGAFSNRRHKRHDGRGFLVCFVFKPVNPRNAAEICYLARIIFSRTFPMFLLFPPSGAFMFYTPQVPSTICAHPYVVGRNGIRWRWGGARAGQT